MSPNGRLVEGAAVCRKIRRKLANKAASEIRYKEPQKASCRGGSATGFWIVGGVEDASESGGCGLP